MDKILYLKTFNGLSGINYQEGSLQISFRHILLGLGILVVAIYLVVASDKRLLAAGVLSTHFWRRRRRELVARGRSRFSAI